MKTAIIIFLSMGTGWFIRSSLQSAIDGEDWRESAGWAAFAAAEIAVILLFL